MLSEHPVKITLHSRTCTYIHKWITSHQAAEFTGDTASCGHIIRTDQCVGWLDLNVVQRDTQYPSSNLGHLEGYVQCRTANEVSSITDLRVDSLSDFNSTMAYSNSTIGCIDTDMNSVGSNPAPFHPEPYRNQT